MKNNFCLIDIFCCLRFRPDGQKYKKAREWQIGVVNAQWLTDLLCGQLNALHQSEAPKYQQFSLGNPFRLDYSLVPHLMGEQLDFTIKIVSNLTRDNVYNNEFANF